ncbi:MAG: histidine phosphatase family protein [Candidatus Taylorbacteria bacterium]|nr:histidine phosphatase family protein [Candidatus Taylorbacteria bacterium]
MIKNSSRYFILRHGKLSLPFKDHSEMPISTLSDLGSGKLNPPIEKDRTTLLIKEVTANFPEILSSKFIYASTIPRTGETAILFQDEIEKVSGVRPPLKKFSELDEVSFDLGKLFEGGEGIAAVNSSVFRGMVSGKNAEFYVDTFARVQSFFNEIASKDGVKLVVAHDFIMRIIEIFIKNKGKIPRSIELNTLEQTKRNTYVKGFITDSNFEDFTPIF